SVALSYMLLNFVFKNDSKTSMLDQGNLTAAQAGLWLGHQLSNTPAVYNCAEELTIEGTFSVERFKQALIETLRAAPSLQVAFVEEAGQPIWRRVPFAARYSYQDLSHERQPERAM